MTPSAGRWPFAISRRVLCIASVLTGCAELAPGAPPEDSALEVRIVQEGVYLSRRLSLLVDHVGAVAIGNPVRDRLVIPVAPGQRRIQLVGLESNCRVAGGASRTVTVRNADVVTAEFPVTCSSGVILGAREMAVVVCDELKGGGSEVARVLDPADMWQALAVPGPEYPAAWAPDGERLVIAGWVNPGRAFERGAVLVERDEECACPVERTGRVSAWNASGSRLATSTGRSRVLIQPDDGVGGAIVTIPREAMDIAGLAWSPAGETLAILAQDGFGSQVRTVYLWSAPSGVTPLLEWVAPPAGYWGKLDWTPDGSALVVGDLSLSSDCQVIAVVPLADPIAWRPLLPCRGPGRIRDLTLAPRRAGP